MAINGIVGTFCSIHRVLNIYSHAVHSMAAMNAIIAATTVQNEYVAKIIFVAMLPFIAFILTATIGTVYKTWLQTLHEQQKKTRHIFIEFSTKHSLNEF